MRHESCVPVIEHFSDTVGIPTYEQCGGAVFASHDEIFDVAIDIVDRIDAGTYDGASSAQLSEWWRDGIRWGEIIPSVYNRDDDEVEEEEEETGDSEAEAAAAAIGIDLRVE